MQQYMSNPRPQAQRNASANQSSHKQNQFSFNSPDPQPDYQLNQTSPLRHRNQNSVPQATQFQQQHQYYSIQNPQRSQGLLEQQVDPAEQAIDSYSTVSRDKLQGKVDAQTERLRYLDNYRVICEKRIRDLAPTHPLPVLPSHWGQQNSDLAQIQSRMNVLLNQTNDNNNATHETFKLRQQIDQLQQEKQQLEVSLRDETLANEEQRNYIQILRNTIDQKMENIGLGDLLNHKSVPQGQDPVAIYSIIQELKKSSDAYKRECKDLQNQLNVNNQELQQTNNIQQDQEQQITAKDNEIDHMRAELEGLRQANTELQECITHNSKEKNDLLEYIEDNVRQIEALGKDLESERLKIEQINTERQQLTQLKVNLENQNHQQYDQISELEANRIVIEDQLEQFKLTIRTLKKDNEVRQTQMEEQTKTISDQSAQLAHNKQTIQYKDVEIDQLKTKVRDFGDQVLNLTKDYDTLSEERTLQEKRFKIEDESLKKKIQMLDDFLHEQEERSRKLEEKHELETELAKRSSDEQIHNLEGKLSHTKKVCSQLDQEVNDLKQLKDQLLEDNTKLDEQLNGLQDQYMQKKNQYDTLKENLIYCQGELEKLKHDHIQLQEELQVERQRREWLSIEREKLQTSLEETRAKLDDETNQKESELRKCLLLERELDEQKKYLGKELTTKTDNATYLQRQLDQVNTELKKSLSQLDYTRQVKNDLESRLNNMQRDYDSNVREKKIQEKIVQDLKEENQHLFKNEERVKRLIEDNEQLKSHIRQKDRDIALLSDRLGKTVGDADNVEKEYKRVTKELTEREFMLESTDKMKGEMQMKVKETESRLFEIHRERQELESKVKASQRQIEDLLRDNEALRKVKGNSDEEKMELTQQVHKLRSRMTEQSITTEHYSKYVDDLELVTKQVADKVKSFLEDNLRKINASDILSDLITRHSKEQMYLFIQNIDNQLITGNAEERLLNCTSFIREFKNFIHTFDNQFTTTINEFLSTKTDNKLLERKVDQLETRIGQIHTTDVVNHEKTKFLSNEIDNIRTQRLQTLQELNQVKDFGSQKQQVIKELETQIQTLQRENRFQAEQNLTIQKEYTAVREEWESKKDSVESNVLSLKQKEQKIGQLQKEKRKLEELISKMHGSVKDQDMQRIFGEISRTLGELFKAQNERIKQELTLDGLERELNTLLKSTGTSDDESTILRAQYLRREINDIEQRVKDCDARTDAYTRKLRNLDAELTSLEERDKIEQFANTGNTQTINYLMKESQDLRNEILEKNSRISTLEQEIEHFKNKQYNEISSIPRNVHQGTLPPKTRNSTAIDSGNNSMMNTFEQRLFDPKHTLADSKRQFSTQDLHSNRVVHLQPIRVEDYDYKPERHEATSNTYIDGLKSGSQTLYSLKPISKPALKNQRQSSQKTLFDQDAISPIQHLQSPPQLDQHFNNYLNETQASKENYSSAYNTQKYGQSQTKFKLGTTTLASPIITSTPLQARLSSLRR